MDAEIAEVEKLNPDLAKKLKDARAAEVAAADGSKAQLAAAEKERKKLEAEAKKYKHDLDEAVKGTDGAAAKAQKERDEAKAEAEEARNALGRARLARAAEKKLGLPDTKFGERGLDAFLAAHGDKITIGEDGQYVGLDAAVETFKKAEAEWWVTAEAPAEKKPQGSRAGSGAPVAKVTPGSGKALTQRQKIDAYKEQQRAAQAGKKKGK